MMFHVVTIVHRIFSVEEIRVFQACLVENPSVQVVCFENHAEWRFCRAPFLVYRALSAQWRLSVLSLLLVFSFCTSALLLNIHLDLCDRTRAISFKQVISTAPPSTFEEKPLFMFFHPVHSCSDGQRSPSVAEVLSVSTEVECVRQQEEQEDKRDEEEGNEVKGEVEDVTHRPHET